MSARWVVRQGDCREIMARMRAACADSIVTDPPYELGFMGKGWDSSGVAFDVRTWQGALRVLKPGGHLVAFGGTRTYHRMACAIEDAGFEVRDSLHWMYGSGFPKSLNLDGAHEGWGTALKPAHEPIILARKPLEGTVAANVGKHGTGALNIDGCRVGAFQNTTPSGANRYNAMLAQQGYRPSTYEQPVTVPDSAPGRWPPNILLSHTPECGDECVEDCAVAELDRQTADLKPRGNKGASVATSSDNVVYGKMYDRPSGAEYNRNDEGGASRFFPVFRYEAKAARSERERGCEGLPARTGAETVDREEGSAGTQSPRAGAGRTAKQVRNHHPTVKPVALMQWLCRLVTPADGLVLDPFAGSGTTGVACMLEGFRFIGLELAEGHPEYLEIARQRIAHAEQVGAAPEEAA